MKIVLDSYDRSILYELDRDSSISLQKLSQKIKKSKPFILYRLERLESEKIIGGYHAIVDMARLGHFTFRVYLKFQNITSEEIFSAIRHLQTSFKQIWTLTRMHGLWDYAIFVGVESMPEFHAVWDEMMKNNKRFIKKSNVSLYTPVYNFNRTFFMDSFDETKVERVYGIGSREIIDEIDRRIIAAYAGNVRVSARSLGAQLHLSPDTVRARIKDLEKRKIIVGYKLNLGLDKLEFTGYRIDLQLLTTEHNKKLYEFCLQHPNIYQVNKPIGGADFEIELIVRNEAHLAQIIDNIMSEFKGVVNDVEYFGFSSFPIIQYIPD